MLFFQVLLGIVIILGILGTVVGTIMFCEEHSFKQNAFIVPLAILILATLISLGLGLIGTDKPSSHCQNGTTYRTQYNVSTKTSTWWCE